MASRIVEKKASYFGKPSEILCEESRRAKPGMAPELFFVYGERDDPDRNLKRMKDMHPYTMESDAFAVGYLARMIWNNEDSTELFKHNKTKIAFGVKLDALVNEDPKKRPSLAKVVEDLMSSRYNFPIPERCFRRKL
jgi:hypothetical protein